MIDTEMFTVLNTLESPTVYQYFSTSYDQPTPLEKCYYTLDQVQTNQSNNTYHIT